ncbi:MAG TPA: FAD-dependent oxidoreductase, partial [bacterium]|nr:FAD-dependent oxidoreductase [bacterium]
MRSDPRELHRHAFDVVVIGAGIQGAAIARDAAVRGLSTLLLEARDVAAGTSSRSSRLVHGGLRYLRQGHLRLVREALRERERLLRLAPHLVRPLPMLMPFFRGGGVPPWQLRLGTLLYARLAGRSTLPRPRRLRPAAALAAFPGLRESGLTGALEFFDARTQDGRLTLANVQDAVAAGAAFVNHARVVAIGGDGLHVVDEVTGDELRLTAGG